MSLTTIKLSLINRWKNLDVQAWWNRCARWLDRPIMLRLAFVSVLFLALWFRFNDLNWDQTRHLHPDERFLSRVTNDIRWTENFDTFFNPEISTLSPYALPNMGLYVYGTLPVYLVKAAAIFLNNNTYDKITLVGRILSSLFDVGAIVFLFLVARRLYDKKVGLLAALLLALSVLNIQLSHFYAVDTFATFFIVATFFFVVRATQRGQWLDYAITGLLFGLGLASKISVATLLVPILLGAGLDFYRRARAVEMPLAIEQTLVRAVTLFVIALLTFRIAQPIAFSGPSFFDFSLNPRWWDDVIEQQKLLSGDGDLPWVQQWTDRSISFAAYNLFVWGMGLPLGLACLAGFVFAAFELVRRRKLAHLLPLAYIVVTFLYHGMTFIKFMRYFLPLYPFLILLAAYCLVALWRYAVQPHASSRAEWKLPFVRGQKFSSIWQMRSAWAPAAIGLVVVGTLLYALAFRAIYDQPHTRLLASAWIFQNIPRGATLANEHWDDWLPLNMEGRNAFGSAGWFKSVELANYEDDTPQKLDKLIANLTQADYLILSSNRLYDSIPRLPMRYPLMTRYYQMLFAGELGFTRVAEFHSYPTLFGVAIPDQSAEESFTVYDHPRVQIFKKDVSFDAKHLREQLSAGIPWNAVLRLTPRQASAAPGSLNLSPGVKQLYQETAMWSSAEISPASWGSQAPVLAWSLMLALIELIALPITLVTFARLRDRGFILSKAIGLLLVAWGAWWVASLRAAPFTWWLIAGVMAAFAIASFLLARWQWNALRAFLAAQWRVLVLQEILFWIFFAAMLFIRSRNPDLWHPAMGGEKPMDLAYLTAIARTPYFPAYDPWFAGGYINYYYFGFVLIAALVHLTGIVPTIAYNLAVPTLFAMTAMGAFTAAFNLGARPQGNVGARAQWFGTERGAVLAGLCGALFVAVIGNLGQVELLWNGIRKLSALQKDANAAPLSALVQFGDGLVAWLGGKPLGFHTEWWYWNATRVIPAARGEAGPINEMPFFTFLFADLHAHMMALPFTLLALALALNFVRDTYTNTTRVWWRDAVEILTLLLAALTTGALFPLNTWDFPTYTLIVIAGLACREYARRKCIDASGIWAVAWRGALIVMLGRFLFLPFFQNYASDYFGVEWWRGSRTPLGAYLVIHGFFLFILTTFLVVDFWNGAGHNSLTRALRLHLKYWRRHARMTHLYKRLVQPEPSHQWGVNALCAAFVLALVIFLLDLVVGLALAFCLFTALLLLRARPQPRRQFMLCLIGLSFFLTAFVEVVVLKGDISRMNTVFKFYLQVWVLWGVSAAAALPTIAAQLSQLHHARIPLPEMPEGSAWTPALAAQVEYAQRNNRNGWAWRWWVVFALLFIGCLFYPLTATPVRINDRFKESTAITLDGTAYQQTSVYKDQDQIISLDAERKAFEWLRANVRGIPTIIEANTPLYRWGGRVSIYTGLPGVIGWDWHQKQQRSVLPGQAIERRIQDVRTIYTTNDLQETARLLKAYDVRYIYVGPLERLYYNGTGLDKFGTEQSPLWKLVYNDAGVKIFRVN